MKEIFKYELAIIIGGNARFKVYFTDGTTRIFTVPIEQLASYVSILRLPDSAFDSVNGVFIGRDRFENRNLKPF